MIKDNSEGFGFSKQVNSKSIHSDRELLGGVQVWRERTISYPFGFFDS